MACTLVRETVIKTQKTKDLRLVLIADTILLKETFKLIQIRSEQTQGTIPPQTTDTPAWLTVLRAAESKKATSCRILDLREVSTLADYFFLCSATSQRQAQTIWDEVEKQMKEQRGEKAIRIEGYSNGEWIVGDFGDLIVHVFTPEKRAYYDLERLWRHAKDALPPGVESARATN